MYLKSLQLSIKKSTDSLRDDGSVSPGYYDIFPNKYFTNLNFFIRGLLPQFPIQNTLLH